MSASGCGFKMLEDKLIFAGGDKQEPPGIYIFRRCL